MAVPGEAVGEEPQVRRAELTVGAARIDEDFDFVEPFGGSRDLQQQLFACLEVEHAARARADELVRLNDLDVRRHHPARSLPGKSSRIGRAEGIGPSSNIPSIPTGQVY